jgi:hypothetical protein
LISSQGFFIAQRLLVLMCPDRWQSLASEQPKALILIVF